MTKRRLASVLAVLLCASSHDSRFAIHDSPILNAQEGHPHVGTWHGTWGPNATERHDVTLVLEFDGKAITGMMNPGPDSVRFDKVTLEPSTWTVRMEATPKGNPRPAPIVIEVTIQDITNRYRSLVGTWTQGAVKGEFKASRDS